MRKINIGWKTPPDHNKIHEKHEAFQKLGLIGLYDATDRSSLKSRKAEEKASPPQYWTE